MWGDDGENEEITYITMYKHLTPQEIAEFEKGFQYIDKDTDNETCVHFFDDTSKDILSFIDTLIGKRKRDLLERYTDFLTSRYFTGSQADILDMEEPTAIDRFLSPDSPKRNEEHDHPSQ